MANVYVLGAGASAEYRSHRLPVPNPPVPTDKTFWSTLDKVIDRIPQGPMVSESEHIDYKSIISFVKAKYDAPELAALDRWGLEKVFSDVAEENPDQLDIFVRLLSWTLFQTIRAINERTAPTHYRLVQNKISPGDTIITFNYDVIIEQVVWNCSRRNPELLLWHPSTGYHVGFAGYLDFLKPRSAPSRLESFPSNVSILKLHGSTGWSCGESSRGQRDRLDKDIYLCLAGQSGSLIGEGFLPLRPVVVPPIQRKQYPSTLQQLWNKAEEALINADHVALIGYRIPGGDSESASLFASTCQHKPVEIVLKGLQTNNAQQRLRQIFPNLKPDSLIDRRFSEWVGS